jgi:hypothetical protein
MMPIFQPPEDLVEIAHFRLPRVQTWGDGKKDALYREFVRQCANLSYSTGHNFLWFAFSIRCIVGESRRRKLGPDVENIPKLIVDAFAGHLYPDDNLDYVRGVQVEAVFGPDADDHAEVWIYGYPTE